MGTAKQKKQELEKRLIENQLKREAKKVFDEGQKDGIYKTFNLIYWVLHDKYGFGEKRLKQLHEEVRFLLDCEDVSVKDIAEALKDECHISIAGEGDIR